MIFVRTLLGIILVACLVALGGLGYRLWDVQRQLSARLKAMEARVASTETDLAAVRARCDRLHAAMPAGNAEPEQP